MQYTKVFSTFLWLVLNFDKKLVINFINCMNGIIHRMYTLKFGFNVEFKDFVNNVCPGEVDTYPQELKHRKEAAFGREKQVRAIFSNLCKLLTCENTDPLLLCYKTVVLLL